MHMTFDAAWACWRLGFGVGLATFGWIVGTVIVPVALSIAGVLVVIALEAVARLFRVLRRHRKVK